MSRLPADKIGNGSHDMAVLGDDHTAVDPGPQAVISGLCHLPGGFSGGYQHHPTRKFLSAQSPLHRRIRLNRPDGSSHHSIRMDA